MRGKVGARHRLKEMGLAGEWEHLLSRCCSPIYAAKLGTFYLNKLASRAVNLVLSSTAHYPSLVRQISKALMVGKSVPCGAVPVIPFRGMEIGKERLRLAHGYYEFTGSPQWETVFDDAEQTVSLHRWNWLPMKLTEEPATTPAVHDWGVGLMRDWIGRMMKIGRGLHWESYTVGERICNAVLFLTFAGRSVETLPKLPDDIARALECMARHLAGHLEYKGPKATGNHVINNARALCFAGQALQMSAATDLAAAILKNDLSELVNVDGFLREGSSHYHLLVTRWLLEILWICRIMKENHLRALVEPVAALMVERCWFFLVAQSGAGRWVMPLIGDVSPDFPWEWLVGLPWSEEARKVYAPHVLPPPPQQRGWGSLFDQNPATRAAQEDLPRPTRPDVPSFQPFPESGWYRLDWAALTIFWHVEPLGAPRFLSHGHCDTGSFCLYWNGVEILMDPGRLNYKEDDLLGAYGVSASAHNNVLIDGCPPFVCWHSNRYPDFYRTGDVRVVWDIQRDGFTLIVHHNGFSRLQRHAITFERAFQVRRNRLVIEDRIAGRSRHAVATYFQWAPGVSVFETEESGRFGIHAGPDRFHARFYAESISEESVSKPADVRWKVVRGEGSEASGGWYFPAYGEKMAACSLVLERKVSLPDTCRYVLQWSD